MDIMKATFKAITKASKLKNLLLYLAKQLLALDPNKSGKALRMDFLGDDEIALVRKNLNGIINHLKFSRDIN